MAEGTKSFRYVLRWTVLGISTGVIAGVGVAVFLKLLTWSIEAWTTLNYYYFFLPLILLLNNLLVNLSTHRVTGGSDKVIEAIHQRYGKMHLATVPVKMAATILTIAAGGSAGKEGPGAQIGATLAAAWAGFLKISDADCRQVAICGLCAGFACVFGTPVAGAIFGIEVLFVGKLLYDTMYPAFVAGLTGYFVCRLLALPYFYLPIHVVPSSLLGVQAILLGVICGAISIFFIKVIHWCQQLFACWRLSPAVKAVSGGTLLVLIGFFASPQYLGLGLELFEAGVQGQPVAATAFLWKTLATGITLGCGGTGGIITPVIVVGTVAGNLFGQLWGTMDVSVYSVIGMAALLAGAVNTPVAAVIMSAELFGSDVLPYTAIGCLISYLISGHRSVYPSQIIFTGKGPFRCDDEGKTVSCVREEAKTAFLLFPARVKAGSRRSKENN